LGERYAKHRPLFLSQSPVPGKRERLGYQGIYYTIKELGQVAGIANLTPHRLRHTYATKLLLKGIDSLHARTLTRHKSEADSSTTPNALYRLRQNAPFMRRSGKNCQLFE
jgi:integrase/recombinase XerD